MLSSVTLLNIIDRDKHSAVSHTSHVFRCRLGERGTTVIFSIHQPRYSIYKMFTNLILLSLGKVVYHGPAPEALDFFSSIGESQISIT